MPAPAVLMCSHPRRPYRGLFFRLVICAGMFCVLFTSRPLLAQQDADNRYLEIYEQVQKANTFLDEGSLPQALDSYQNALVQLQNFRQIYPDWNPDIVSYRFADIQDKVASLKNQLPTSNPLPTASVSNSTPSTSQPATETNRSDSTILLFQQQVESLRAQNARLQAQLQEALAQEPSPSDRSALEADAEEIRLLMKENSLLKLSQSGQTAPSPSTNRFDRSGSASFQSNATPPPGARQNADMLSLSNENQVLKRKLASMMKEIDFLRQKLEKNSAESHVPPPISDSVAHGLSTREDLEKQLSETASALVQTDERYEESLFELTRERNALARQLIDQGATTPVNQEIQINTQPPSEATHEVPTRLMALNTNSDTGFLSGPAPALQGHALNDSDPGTAGGGTHGDARSVQAAALISEEQKKTALGDFTAALTDLQMAANLQTNNPEIQNQLGLTLERMGLRQPAESALLRALHLNPLFSPAHLSLAFFYLSEKPPLVQLARWHYEQALRLGATRNAGLEKSLAFTNEIEAIPAH